MASSEDSTDRSIKTYLALWFTGLMAGVVIMRWRRSGRDLVPKEPGAGEAVETSTNSTAPAASPDNPKVSAVLVAGAKADVERVRNFVKRVTPGTSSSTTSPTTPPTDSAGLDQPPPPADSPATPA